MDTSKLPPLDYSDLNYEDIASDALAAFWRVVCSRIPASETWEMPPMEEGLLQQNMEEIIERFVELNAPSQD